MYKDLSFQIGPNGQQPLVPDHYLQQYNMRTAPAKDRATMFSSKDDKNLYKSTALPSLTTPLVTQRSVSLELFLYSVF